EIKRDLPKLSDNVFFSTLHYVTARERSPGDRATLFQDFFSSVGFACRFGFVLARLAGFRALAPVLARSALHSAQRAVIRSLRALRPAAEMCGRFVAFFAARPGRRLRARRSSF